MCPQNLWTTATPILGHHVEREYSVQNSAEKLGSYGNFPIGATYFEDIN
jgi:hypothetical protein